MISHPLKKQLVLTVIGTFALVALSGCQLLPEHLAGTSQHSAKESEHLPADQLIQLHAQACQLTAKEPEQASAEQNQQTTEQNRQTTTLESKQALAEFFNRYCQHSYRNPVDTANALHKLRQQYSWPEHVLAYFSILDQQLLHHREALSARAILRRRGEKSDDELSAAISALKQTSADLAQTLEALAKTEQDLLLRQFGQTPESADNDVKSLKENQRKDKKQDQQDDQNKPIE
ncbi:hypothetical protein J7384_01910 [Endozoicomonas sp. G2_1]|uniref:hypothetical protein n=1 Tax=Endozoicomonas sp. G2_1 TaxID=2821091 RepID=UPI001AD95373|nr:hypothetical protein [Endozoicomonas sp. G2_1]MBO9489108.1 hypothetical protein [Endozoicomonas sp. G2_1]